MTAVEEGSSGNDISVEIHTPQGDDAPDDIFTIQVKRGGRIEETFEGLSSKKGKQNAATVVNAQRKLIQLEEVGNLGFAERRPAPGAVTLAGGAAARRRRARGPTTTSATAPTAPASAVSRRSTPSPWSRSRT